MIPNFDYVSEAPGGLVPTEVDPCCVGSQPRVYDSVAPGWSLRFCISNKFPGNVDHTLSSPDEEDESGPSQGSRRAHLLQDGGMERQPSVS